MSRVYTESEAELRISDNYKDTLGFNWLLPHGQCLMYCILVKQCVAMHVSIYVNLMRGMSTGLYL